MNLKFRGLHGTCVSHARSILSNGVKAAHGGRAGAGFYLWAYISDSSRAAELAEDWYHWKLGSHDYDICTERGFALLTCEIEIDGNAYLNLNQARHHETLRTIKARLPEGEEQARVYDEYLASQSAFRLKQYGVPLKVVEAMVPFPQATKKRHDGPPLTPGADAYIVLHQGLSELLVVDWKPVGLRR